MNKVQNFFTIFILFFLLGACSLSPGPTWQSLGEGVSLARWDESDPTVRIWVLRFDRNHRSWQWLWEGSYGRLQTVKEFVDDNKILGAINAGPYWGKGVPLGYLKTPDTDYTGPSQKFWALAWDEDYQMFLLPPGEEALENQWVIGGYFPLLLEGTPYSTLEERHPRTAVAWDQRNRFIFWVAVDGRHLSSVGMSEVELADFLLRLGAHNALNFDGGGSTTLVIDYGQGPEVVNNPRDDALFGGERPVASKIGFFLRDRR